MGRAKKARLPILFVVLLLIAYTVNSYVESSSLSRLEETYVTKVVDGDTIVIAGGQRVRLLSIDARERGKSCYDEAKKRMEELVLLKNVTIERDKENEDQYDRLLRYVYVGDTMVNLQMVYDGLAVAYIYEPNEKYRDDFLEAEQAARQENGCVWANLP
ncbi:MAG: thermonuclease family protein [Candidatus Aenigmarchaeota archaeon]|nr:thermonuclease family protein [Candidatus Aenigmarchaeota archaeon]